MAFRHDKRYVSWFIQKKQRERREAMKQEPEAQSKKEGTENG